MDADDVAAFAKATAKLRADPLLIHKPELGFFREFLLTWKGVQLPARPAVTIDLSDGEAEVAEDVSSVRASRNGAEASATKGVAASVDTVVDSDDEDPERLPEESEPPPPMPSCGNLEPSEAEMESCNAAKQLASEAMDAGDELLALERFTQAVLSGGASALLFARRAELLLKLRRPKAAILDCSAALEVNPECGKAFRIRGIANRKLGRWEAASRDLSQGQKLDYDEDIVDVQKLVDARLKPQAGKRRQAKTAGKPQGKRAKVAQVL